MDSVKTLFGNDNPIDYIKGNHDTTEFGLTKTYVVSSPTINKKADDSNYGFIIKLGGMDWMVVSMTLANMESENDTAVLTLYLADDYEQSTMFYSSATASKGNNMYSSSILRKNLLELDDFKIFSDATDNDSFAAKYLIQPQNVKYQEIETIANRDGGMGGAFNAHNDAYGVTGSWYGGMGYAPDFTFNGAISARYDAWKEDYIWIPSVAETGFNSYVNRSNVWKLTSAQRAHSVKTKSWLRSGWNTQFTGSYTLKSNGDWDCPIFTLKHNKLLTNKQNKGLLCEVMHVHDCDILSDELAEKCIESKNVESIDESYIETLKLDDIDAKFQDGNRVTLEKLKKVGLVSEECTGYTVTAGQRLTKPLIIVANDFKLSAVKMITLTGGRAIKLNKI